MHLGFEGITVIKSMQKRIFLLVTLILFGLLFHAPVYAQNVDKNCATSDGEIPQINSLSDIPVGQARPLSSEYFLDPDGQFGPDSITAQKFSFAPCETSFSVPREGGALWLRFKVNNPHLENKTWGVAFMEIIFDEVILFEKRGRELVTIARNGRIVPPDEKADGELKTAVPFRIDAEQEKTYYVRVSGTYAPNIIPVLISMNLLSDWSKLFSIISALLLGFGAMMTLFSLIFFRHIDTRFYRYYAIYMTSLFCFSFLYDGWFGTVFGVTISIDQMKPYIELLFGIALLANIEYCRVLLTIDIDPRQRKQRVFNPLFIIGAIATVFAVIDPWKFDVPLPVIFFLGPLVLLFVSIQKMRDGMKQAVPVGISLLCLTLGFSFSNYSYIFPAILPETSSIFELVWMRPTILGYGFALIGEGIFMMVAISTMLNAMQKQRNNAVMEAIMLRGKMALSEEQEEARKAAGSRMETLDALLASGLDKKLPAPAEQSFLDQATQSVIQNVNEHGFGAGALASALGVTEKTLGRRLKKSQGLTPAAFIRSIRLSYARDLILLRQFDTVAEVANASGFASLSHFAKLYRQEFRITPSEAFRTMSAVR